MIMMVRTELDVRQLLIDRFSGDGHDSSLDLREAIY